jgi:hypothetical protein
MQLAHHFAGLIDKRCSRSHCIAAEENQVRLQPVNCLNIFVELPAVGSAVNLDVGNVRDPEPVKLRGQAGDSEFGAARSQ